MFLYISLNFPYRRLDAMLLSEDIIRFPAVGVLGVISPIGLAIRRSRPTFSNTRKPWYPWVGRTRTTLGNHCKITANTLGVSLRFICIAFYCFNGFVWLFRWLFMVFYWLEMANKYCEMVFNNFRLINGILGLVCCLLLLGLPIIWMLVLFSVS